MHFENIHIIIFDFQNKQVKQLNIHTVTNVQIKNVLRNMMLTYHCRQIQFKTVDLTKTNDVKSTFYLN